MATWDDVRAMAAQYPGTEERMGHLPTIRIGGRAFVAWRKALGAVAVRVEPAMAETVMASRPDVFFTTDHYAGLPWRLIRLGVVDPVELAGVLDASARFATAGRQKRATRS